MKRLLTTACLLASAAACLAQDPAAFEKGQKYLDKIAKAWSAKSPQSFLLAVYAGDKYIGKAKYTVTAADGGFEMTGEAEMAMGEMKMTSHAKGKLGPNLCVVSGETVDETNEPGGNSKKTITTANGKWTVSYEKGGKTQTKEGDLSAGTTWAPTFFALFAIPDDAEVCVSEPDIDVKTTTFKKLDAKEKVSVGGKEIECSVIESKKGEGTTHFLFGPDGALVEMKQEGGPLHMRPATEADLGKDLGDGAAAELSAPAKAVVAVYCAIKRNDAAALDAAFDFDRWAAEGVEGFDQKTDEEKQKAADDLAKQILAELNTDELRTKLPDEASITAMMGPQIKVEMAGEGEAVAHIGDGTWKLYLSTDEAGKGVWLIYSVK